MTGWGKIKACARYAGLSERSFRKFLAQGLKFSRLTTGTILIRYSDIDDFLYQFQVVENEVEKITDEICKEIL